MTITIAIIVWICLLIGLVWLMYLGNEKTDQEWMEEGRVEPEVEVAVCSFDGELDEAKPGSITWVSDKALKELEADIDAINERHSWDYAAATKEVIERCSQRSIDECDQSLE